MMNKNKLGKSKPRTPFDILPEGEYSVDLQFKVRKEFLESLSSDNDSFTKLHRSANALAHATMLGYIERSVANTVAYQFQFMMMVMIQIKQHETPASQLDARWFDKDFMLKLTPDQIDIVLKETNDANKILLINSYIEEQSTVDAEVKQIEMLPALPKGDTFASETKRLLKRIKVESDKLSTPEIRESDGFKADDEKEKPDTPSEDDDGEI